MKIKVLRTEEELNQFLLGDNRLETALDEKTEHWLNSSLWYDVQEELRKNQVALYAQLYQPDGTAYEIVSLYDFYFNPLYSDEDLGIEGGF